LEDKYNEEEDSSGIKVVPVFSKCNNYDSNLSTVASEVKFVHLDAEPPIDDFHIYDVEISDNYIFLSGLSQIMQYDRHGKYIRDIGSRGMGPEEFINIMPPLQLDRKNDLVYASDLHRERTVIYHFDGTYKGAFSKGGCIAVIGSSIIALRQTSSDMYRPECPSIRFIDHRGNDIRTYRSRLYPVEKSQMEIFPDASFLWESKGNHYFMEYGGDTIYQIKGDTIIPERIVFGDLKPKKKDLFRRNIGQNLRIFSYILRPNAGVFESDNFMVFSMKSDYETFYMIYNKSTSVIHRTFYKDAREIITNPVKKLGYKKMDYFIDDLVSGLSFNPQYQSYGKAIALIPATEVAEKREDILRFIASHPSDESARLKALVEKMDEFDNPLVMMVTFK
jgi:hypothetical protein